MKKRILLATPLLMVVGIVWFTRPMDPDTTVPVKSVQTSNHTTEPSPETTVTTVEAPAPAEPTVTAPEPTQATVDAKTVSHAKILADGWDDEQIQCFDMIMDKLYNWDITGDEAVEHVTNIENNYISFCAAWTMLTRYPNGYHPTI